MCAVLVDRIIGEVLSYGTNDYLYTGTVCHDWYNLYGVSRETDSEQMTVSLSRAKESDRSLFSSQLFYVVAMYGSSDVMRWLKDNGCPWDSHTFYGATHDLDKMKWLKENGCPWDSTIFCKVASIGNLKNMKWLKENKCPWNSSTFFNAARNGNLDHMKWLKENKCSWNTHMFNRASETGILLNTEYEVAQGEWVPMGSIYFQHGREKRESGQHEVAQGKWMPMVTEYVL